MKYEASDETSKYFHLLMFRYSQSSINLGIIIKLNGALLLLCVCVSVKIEMTQVKDSHGKSKIFVVN